MTHLSSFVLVVSILGSALAGCGSSDDTEANLKTGGLPAGITRVACYEASSKQCTMNGESGDGIQSRKDDCTSQGGTVGDHCPSDGLTGCCVIAGLGECFYDASMASADQSSCATTGTTWQTSAP